MRARCQLPCALAPVAFAEMAIALPPLVWSPFTVTVPLSSVLSARVTDKALGEVFGMRFPGTGLPGLELVGTFISADLGRTFAVCHGRGEGVVIELDVDVAGFDRVVATVDDPEAIVAELS